MFRISGKYFFGNEISEYGQQNGYVDYGTLAKAFDAVMANDIMERTNGVIGWWEPETDEYYYEDYDGNRYDYDGAQEKIQELQEQIDDLTDKITDESTEEEDAETSAKIDELQRNIDCLEDERYYDVFQWFIVDDNGAEILKEAKEIVYYNSDLDMYLWGVTHWGTSWDYVLTNIRCNVKEDD